MLSIEKSNNLMFLEVDFSRKFLKPAKLFATFILLVKSFLKKQSHVNVDS